MSSQIRRHLGACLLATVPLLCIAAEPASLIGEWEATSASGGGKERAKVNFEGMRWSIGEKSLEITAGKFTPAGLAGKGALKCSYSVDNTQTPAHFNWTLGAGEKKTTVPAIYELKGDVLRVCFPQHGEPRPDSFNTQGKKWSLYEFKRAG